MSDFFGSVGEAYVLPVKASWRSDFGVVWRLLDWVSQEISVDYCFSVMTFFKAAVRRELRLAFLILFFLNATEGRTFYRRRRN